MGPFTFVPLWIIQDVIILAAGLVFVVYVYSHEEDPTQRVLELLGFCFLNAAVYENFATLMKWYGYGRSILMIGNVPFTIPLVEYLVIYSSLRLLGRTTMPAWAKPLVVGMQGMIFDLSLDPVALRQVFQTHEGTIGRWTWFPGPQDVQLYAEPVYNFSGWILLCGYSAATILLGRAWFARSGKKPWVGIAYPLLAALVALGVMVSPLSQFLLWLAPFGAKGQVTEWVMLGVLSVLGLSFVLGLGLHRRPGVGRAGLRSEYLAFCTLVGLPLINLGFCLGGRIFTVVGLVGGAVVLGLGLCLALGSLPYREAAKKAGSS